jgi:hypothetical protein
MIAMKTYLIVWFNSNGAKPSDVTERLLSMGFRPIEGQHDYVYDWGTTPDVNDVLKIGDQVQNVLKGSGVLFKLETI